MKNETAAEIALITTATALLRICEQPLTAETAGQIAAAADQIAGIAEQFEGV